jgi:hypothetical protein
MKYMISDISMIKVNIKLTVKVVLLNCWNKFHDYLLQY